MYKNITYKELEKYEYESVILFCTYIKNSLNQYRWLIINKISYHISLTT